MSDQTPNRTIGGLSPRKSAPDLSRLQRRNRTAITPAPGIVLADSQAVYSPKSVGTSASEPTQPDKSTRVSELDAGKNTAETPSGASTVADKARLTIYLPRNLNHRARAVYRATNHLEHDGSWSDFVEHAIEAEVQRRERLYNNGKPYDSDLSPLVAGRPPQR